MLQLFQSFSVVPLELRPLFYMAGVAALLIAIVGAADRIRLWGLGGVRRRRPLKDVSLWRLVWLSLTKLFAVDCLLARRVFARSWWRGLMVMAFVWSSLALGLATALSTLFYVAHRSLPAWLLRLADPALDIAGLLLLLGLLAALGRRYVFRPARWISVSGDGLLLNLFALAVLSGLLMEAVRLVGSEGEAIARWPVGTALAAFLTLLNPDGVFWFRGYPALYFMHAGAGLALLAYLPFSKLFHLLASQITTFAASPHLSHPSLTPLPQGEGRGVRGSAQQ